MSNVLYDAPGPRARRRALIGTVLVSLALLALAVLVVRRLDARGQLEWELWAPLVDPGSEEFPLVWELLGEALWATLTAAGLAIAFSLVVGTIIGTARMMLGRWQRIPLVAVIELFRGLPVVVTIFYVYTLVQTADIDISALPGEDGLWYVVIGLTLYNSVIIAEILRAGVTSLPDGQREAALAVGMTPRQGMMTVQLPQAYRTMLPALISQLVVILKDSSLAGLLGLYIELLRRGQLISQFLDSPIQVLFVVGLMYIVINYTLSRAAVLLERWLSRNRGGRAAMEQVEQVVPAT